MTTLNNKITFEDIKNANDTLKPTIVKDKPYIEVNQRIKAFRMCYPRGSIETAILYLENGVVTMQSVIKDEEGIVLGTGLAQEKESSSFINKTSFIENCETSAVGRALGMCGFGIDTSVASYEEVANAIENQKPKKEEKKVQMITDHQYKTIINAFANDGDKLEAILKKNGLNDLKDMTMEQAKNFIIKLNSKG